MGGGYEREEDAEEEGEEGHPHGADGLNEPKDSDGEEVEEELDEGCQAGDAELGEGGGVEAGGQEDDDGDELRENEVHGGNAAHVGQPVQPAVRDGAGKRSSNGRKEQS